MKRAALSVRLREADKDRILALAAHENRSITTVVTRLVRAAYATALGDVAPAEALRRAGEAS